MIDDLPASAWLRRLSPAPRAEHRLLCFPHGGGTAGSYRPLANALAPDVDVVAAQYPGRQDRISDPLVTDIITLADHAVCALPSRPRTPIALFGHSMGATVAYEAARMLADRNIAPCALFVSGRPAPDWIERGELHTRPDADLLDDLRRLGGPDSRIVDTLIENPDLAEMVLPFVRADYQAVETYRHGPGDLLSCPIVGLVATEDPTTSTEQIEEWADYTTGDFELHTFRGGHFYLDANLAAVAAVINDVLSR